MDGLNVFLIVLLGLVSGSHTWIFGSELQMKVRPGDNITIKCDCKSSSGVYIVWYRNCSHENQPTLVLRTKYEQSSSLKDFVNILNPFPRFHLVKNNFSQSYDLLIMNITDSDEGLYYCGTEQKRVEDEVKIASKYVYRYGNVTTRILFNSSEPNHQETVQHCDVCWMLLFSLCPTFAILSSLLSSLLVYRMCQKKAKEPQVYEKRPSDRDQTKRNLDEDVCYTALEIHPRPKTKRTHSSDFAIYSAIKTSSM